MKLLSSQQSKLKWSDCSFSSRVKWNEEELVFRIGAFGVQVQWWNLIFIILYNSIHTKMLPSIFISFEYVYDNLIV